MCLWCYSECVPTPGMLKNLPDHGGNGTRDLWLASPMLCQLHELARRGFDSHRRQADFSTCSVWINTKRNTTNTNYKCILILVM